MDLQLIICSVKINCPQTSYCGNLKVLFRAKYSLKTWNYAQFIHHNFASAVCNSEHFIVNIGSKKSGKKFVLFSCDFVITKFGSYFCCKPNTTQWCSLKFHSVQVTTMFGNISKRNKHYYNCHHCKKINKL